MKKNVFRVYYSRIAGAPLVGRAFLFAQAVLLHYNLTDFIFISRRASPQRSALCAELFNKKGKKILCAWQLGYQLRVYKQKYVLAIAPKFDLKSMSTAQLYNLMWAIHFAKRIDSGSRRTLSPLLST